MKNIKIAPKQNDHMNASLNGNAVQIDMSKMKANGKERENGKACMPIDVKHV